MFNNFIELKDNDNNIVRFDPTKVVYISHYDNCTDIQFIDEIEINLDIPKKEFDAQLRKYKLEIICENQNA